MSATIDLTLNRKSAFIWDVEDHENDFEDVIETMNIMGIVPPSGEGIEIEHVRSHIREALTVGYAPIIEAYTRFVAEIHCCHTLDELEAADPEIGEELLEATAATYNTVVRAVLGMITMDELERMKANGELLPQETD